MNNVLRIYSFGDHFAFADKRFELLLFVAGLAQRAARRRLKRERRRRAGATLVAEQERRFLASSAS